MGRKHYHGDNHAPCCRFHTNISSLQHCTTLSLTNQDYTALNISDFPKNFVVPKLGPIYNQGTCGYAVFA